jgi:NAD(P)-dependent dehydrogenase (short-subunit alcohol dehydrogenase family)
MMTSNSKVALVTGGNRGIGFQTCRMFGRLGFRVVLTSRRSDLGERAAEALVAEGSDAVFQVLDVTDEKSIERCAEYAKRELGRVDVLVNNAGVMLDSSRRGASILEAEAALLKESFETNTLGPLLVAQAFVPLMRSRDYGRIVNLSSAMGQLSEMGGQYPGYRISKTALNAVTRILANELEGTNIKVNSICPAWVRTDMGGPNALRTTQESADTVVWLATLPDDGPSGGLLPRSPPDPVVMAGRRV